MAGYVMALDAGTTSCRAMVFDANRSIICSAQAEFTQIYPAAGYVEHDATEIFAVQYGVLSEALAKANLKPAQLAGIGITNQRETTVVWDKITGEPVYNAIVWQCRRTAPICEKLLADGLGDYVRQATGLLADAYFSATKLKWILDNVPGVRARAERGELLFGTVDCWLVWKLTGGKAHVTDYTNAARTMMFNINTLKWDEKILNYLNIPENMLPEVRYSDEIYGTVNLGGCEVPVAGMAGDQQAALFGQRCFERGEAKNTYGTGCFMLCNVGDKPVMSKNRLLCTIGIAAQNRISYALEGSVFTAGALIQWLRDELGIIERACDSEKLAAQCSDTGGVYVVPAFTGLGAPHWDMYARGAIFGLTRGSGRAQLARAALEAIAYQTADVLNAMRADTGIRLSRLRVDGGASANDLLLQIQADLADITVERPGSVESTALGAACLCGLATGFWSMEQIRRDSQSKKLFEPAIDDFHRKLMFAGWRKAVERSKNWEAN